MAIKTGAGLVHGDVGALGIKTYGANEALTASDLNNSLADEQTPAALSLLAGVLSGGACTGTTLLNVTIPSGTSYYARQVWTFDADAVLSSVADNATTYFWGCSDGQIRNSADTTPPGGFDNRTACIITKAVALAGVVTMDNTVQQKGRYADAVNRCIVEGAPLIGGGFLGDMDTIPLGVAAKVKVGYQKELFGRFRIIGKVTICGRVRVKV